MAETIPIDRISTEGTQTRAGTLNDVVINEYAEAYEQGIELPAVDVYFNGDVYWLADGFHRLRAVQQIGRDSITANIHPGGQRDAIIFGVKANDTHGLRRSNTDRRYAVRILLTDPEWSQWSNSEIARQCNVSEHLVRMVLDEIGPKEIEQVKEETKKARRRGKEYTVHTGRIGTSRKMSRVEPPATAAEQPVPPVTEGASVLPTETTSSPASKIESDPSITAPVQPPAETASVTSSETELDTFKVVEEIPPMPAELNPGSDAGLPLAVSVISAAAAAELSLEDAWEWATQADRENFVVSHRDELQKIFRKLEKAAT